MEQVQQAVQAAIAGNPLTQGIATGLQRLHSHIKPLGAGPYRREGPRVIVPPRHGLRAAPVPFAAIIPGDSVGEVVLTTGVLNFLQLYNSALVVRLVLTWFPEPPAFLVGPLATITDPYLGLFRGIIPPIGGTLDLSPILAFVTLSFFTSSAAALPCEIGKEQSQQAPQQRAGLFGFLQPSKFEQAWQRRVQAQKSARAQEQASNGGTAA